MVEKDNPYTKMQKAFYNATKAREMAGVNHRQHDNNRHYWRVLLRSIRNDSAKWKGKIALDFGCGTGRNICNLLRMANWKRVDGVDISENNLKEADIILKKEGNEKFLWDLYVNDGIDLQDLKTEEYDFVMSTITFPEGGQPQLPEFPEIQFTSDFRSDTLTLAPPVFEETIQPPVLQLPIIAVTPAPFPILSNPTIFPLTPLVPYVN